MIRYLASIFIMMIVHACAPLNSSLDSSQLPQAENPGLIQFDSLIDEDTEKLFIKDVQNLLEKGKNTIYIQISTSGGNLSVALRLYHYIESLSNSGIHIITFNNEKVQSAGTYLYLAGKTRWATPEASFMIHPASTRFQESVTEKQVGITQQEMTFFREQMTNILLTRTHLTSDEIKTALLTEERPFNATEAERAGIVDKITSIGDTILPSIPDRDSWSIKRRTRESFIVHNGSKFVITGFEIYDNDVWTPWNVAPISPMSESPFAWANKIGSCRMRFRLIFDRRAPLEQEADWCAVRRVQISSSGGNEVRVSLK